MKKYIVFCVASLFLLGIINLNGQDTTTSSPITPGKVIYSFKLGIFGGLNYLLGPEELVNSPTKSSATVEKSLLNGLDGLGYSVAWNGGIIARYPFLEKLSIGINISATGWKSTSSCNCKDSLTGKSENALSLYHFGIYPQYFIFSNLYAAPEISMNIFGVSAKENSSRGNLDFQKNYTRIGAGLALGYELPLMKKLSLDVSVKTQFPNLVLGDGDNKDTPESESLIPSNRVSGEPMMFILSGNLGILFSF